VLQMYQTPTYVNLPISNFKILNNILSQSIAKSLLVLRNEDAKFCSEDVCSTVQLIIFSHWNLKNIYIYKRGLQAGHSCNDSSTTETKQIPPHIQSR
jgi:hypothetical protein